MTDHSNRARTLLIFDLDGTLYRTESSFVPTMRSVYEEYGVPYPSDEAILGQVGEPFSTFLDWLGGQGFPVDRAEVAHRITELELASIEHHGNLFDGVEETLRVLRDAGHAITLCTNGDMLYAERVLSSCGILELFDALQTNEIDGTTKIELVRELLVQVNHSLAFMVGDRYHDMEAGRANGCTVIAAAYGYGTAEELANADRQISLFPELLSVLG